jgi:hypothetical protein
MAIQVKISLNGTAYENVKEKKNMDLTSIIGGSLGSVVKDVIGMFKLSPEKKAELQAEVDKNAHEIEMKQYELQARLQDAEQKMVDAQRDIIVAEMQQGDAFTKRARPALVYAGLLFIALNHVVLPYISYFTGKGVPPIELPSDFWWAWTGCVGVWMVGRTMEKRGSLSSTVKMITGSSK